MDKLLNFIRPPEDADWKAVNRWRWNVTLTLMVLMIAGGFSLRHVAWASDTEKKITAVQSFMVVELDKQSKVIDRINRLLSDNLAESTAAKLRLAIAKRCKAPAFSIERSDLNEEIRQGKQKYRVYAGEEFDEPTCDQL